MFGAERRGAPVEAYARISNAPIRRHSQVYRPDVVAVFDPKIMEAVDVLRGLKTNGILLLNSPEGRFENKFGGFRVYCVDATGIAIKLGLYFAGFPAVNTAIVGALAKATGIFPMEAVLETISSTWSGRVGELNSEAAKLAYNSIGGD
jgi:pyruvate ferredoxin oxidoreductase gamma subunit